MKYIQIHRQNYFYQMSSSQDQSKNLWFLHIIILCGVFTRSLKICSNTNPAVDVSLTLSLTAVLESVISRHVG
jgi:hypothetical protein